MIQKGDEEAEFLLKPRPHCDAPDRHCSKLPCVHVLILQVNVRSPGTHAEHV